MNNLPEIFTGVAPSKSEIQTQCDAVINEIKDGGSVNPLKVATVLKSLEIAMKTIKDGISDAILEEAEKHESKSFDFDGHALSIRESGVKYDYSGCNDPIMNGYLSDMESLKEKIKTRESFLKSIDGSMTIVDEETGDINEVFPPSKSSTTSVTINLKK